MNAHLVELARKREALVARSAAQREQLRSLVGQLEGPLAIADKGVAVARFVRAHPLAIAGGGVVAAYLITSRLGGVRKLAGLVWQGWRAFRRARSWWAKGTG